MRSVGFILQPVWLIFVFYHFHLSKSKNWISFHFIVSECSSKKCRVRFLSSLLDRTIENCACKPIAHSADRQMHRTAQGETEHNIFALLRTIFIHKFALISARLQRDLRSVALVNPKNY